MVDRQQDLGKAPEFIRTDIVTVPYGRRMALIPEVGDGGAILGAEYVLNERDFNCFWPTRIGVDEYESIVAVTTHSIPDWKEADSARVGETRGAIFFFSPERSGLVTRAGAGFSPVNGVGLTQTEEELVNMIAQVAQQTVSEPSSMPPDLSDRLRDFITTSQRQDSSNTSS